MSLIPLLWNFRTNEENNLCRSRAEETAYVIPRLRYLPQSNAKDHADYDHSS